MQHLNAHISAIADTLGAHIFQHDDFFGRAGMRDEEPFIAIPHTTTLRRYFLALHELGHVALGHVRMRPMDLSEEEVAQKEGEAHLWALDHALVQPSWEVRAELLDALSSYEPYTNPGYVAPSWYLLDARLNELAAAS